MNLTQEQKNAFGTIWFIYGNYGSKFTDMNHKLIQGYYQYDEDRLKSYQNAMKARIKEGNPLPDKMTLTEECIKVCKLILKGKIEEALEIAKQKQ